MTKQFTIEQQQFAKALDLAYGNTREVKDHIKVLADAVDSRWPGVPSQETIRQWRLDLRIVADPHIIEQYQSELRVVVVAQVKSILEPLAGYIKELIGTEGNRGKPLDILNLTKSWGITVDKVQPSRFAGANIFAGPTQLNAPGAQGMMMPFSLKPELTEGESGEVIDVEAS